jgi:hypothetical protein
MDWGLWDHLLAEAAVIAHAPIAFVLVLIVGCVIGAMVIGRLNKATIDGANSARDAAIQSSNYWKDRANASGVAMATPSKPRPAKQGPRQDVKSVNQSGGITAGTVNVGKQEFSLTPQIMSNLLSKAIADKPVVIQAIGGERAMEMGMSLEKAFRAAGFEVRTNWIGVQSPPPDTPVSISLLPNRTVVTIAPNA